MDASVLTDITRKLYTSPNKVYASDGIRLLSTETNILLSLSSSSFVFTDTFYYISNWPFICSVSSFIRAIKNVLLLDFFSHTRNSRLRSVREEGTEGNTRTQNGTRNGGAGENCVMRSSMFSHPRQKYYWSDQIKEHTMSRECLAADNCFICWQSLKKTKPQKKTWA